MSDDSSNDDQPITELYEWLRSDPDSWPTTEADDLDPSVADRIVAEILQRNNPTRDRRQRTRSKVVAAAAVVLLAGAAAAVTAVIATRDGTPDIDSNVGCRTGTRFGAETSPPTPTSTVLVDRCLP